MRFGAIETRLLQIRQLDPNIIENAEVLVRRSLQMCQWVLLLEPYVPGADLLLDSLIQVSNALLSEVEGSDRRRRGCPSFQISEEQLLFFIQHNFKVTEISRLFGCSRRTVERRLREYDISARSNYSRMWMDTIN